MILSIRSSSISDRVKAVNVAKEPKLRISVGRFSLNQVSTGRRVVISRVDVDDGVTVVGGIAVVEVNNGCVEFKGDEGDIDTDDEGDIKGLGTIAGPATGILGNFLGICR